MIISEPSKKRSKRLFFAKKNKTQFRQNNSQFEGLKNDLYKDFVHEKPRKRKEGSSSNNKVSQFLNRFSLFYLMVAILTLITFMTIIYFYNLSSKMKDTKESIQTLLTEFKRVEQQRLQSQALLVNLKSVEKGSRFIFFFDQENKIKKQAIALTQKYHVMKERQEKRQTLLIIVVSLGILIILAAFRIVALYRDKSMWSLAGEEYVEEHQTHEEEVEYPTAGEPILIGSYPNSMSYSHELGTYNPEHLMAVEDYYHKLLHEEAMLEKKAGEIHTDFTIRPIK